MARSRVRLKLVSVGLDKILLLRIVGYRHPGQQKLAMSLIGEVADGAVTFDGEVYRIRAKDLGAIARRANTQCEALYDPNLERGVPALPNPWPLQLAPVKDFSTRPEIYMARVRHPDLGEALAFHTPRYDDDFMIDFRKKTGGDAAKWRRWRDDFKVWAVSEHYEHLVHAALDAHFTCYWDEFIAGEEWDVIAPPEDTIYPRRGLKASDFAVFKLTRDCSREELSAAYVEYQRAYRENQIDLDTWDDIDVAHERILRHHQFTKREFEGREPVGPLETIRQLKSWIPDPDERSRWFHAYNHLLGATPSDLVQDEAGDAMVRAHVMVMMGLTSG